MDYAKLPQVDRVIRAAAEHLEAGGAAVRPAPLARAARAAVEQLRARADWGDAGRAELLARAAEDALARYRAELRPSLRPVLNATGVVLHTNLGRAPLAEAAVRAAEGAAGFCNLELDLAGGTRGSRHDHVSGLLRDLTGAEDALVVNNNAAAVLLALDTLARGGEAVISRGQLVEIGGGFRVPEVIQRGGAVLREVGTTNKTRLSDYAGAIGPDTACLLQIHPSNFYMGGFVESVPTAELAALAHAHGLPLVCDLGSGCLYPFAAQGVGKEPLAAQVLEAGADVLTFSGDKLLGGPQAGVVVGRRHWLEPMKANPLLRALRVDKLTLAALEATLALYRDGRAEEIPVVAMLTAGEEALRARAETLGRALADCPARVALTRRDAPVGGGAMPEVRLPAWVVEVEPESGDAEALMARLRTGEPAVLGYLREGRACFDPRTLRPGELEAAARAIRAALT